MTKGQESEILSLGSKISASILDILDCRLGRKILDSLSDETIIIIQEEIESKVMRTISERIEGIKTIDGGLTEEIVIDRVNDGKEAVDIAKEFDVPFLVVKYRIDKLKEKGWI